jgi:hypothetical protein
MSLPLQTQTQTLTRGVLRGVTVLVLAALAFQAVGPESRVALRAEGDVRIAQKVMTEAVVRRADRLERRQQHKPIPASAVVLVASTLPPRVDLAGVTQARPPICYRLPAGLTDLPPPSPTMALAL